jgi:hypothetical protein
LTKRAKASLQQRQAATTAPPKPRRAPSSTNSLARPADWSGNQSRLHKLASPALDHPQQSQVATGSIPNLFLPKPPGQPKQLTPFSELPGLAGSVGRLTDHKNIDVPPAEDHHHPDTAKNKDTIRTFGSKANTLLAVAMEENNTVSSHYPFGDTYPELKLEVPDPNPYQAVRDFTSGPSTLSEPKPEFRAFQPDELPGWPKTGDAANFGLYKMNWLMIRQTEKGKSLIKEELEIQTKAIHDRGQDFAPTDWNVEAAVGHKINASTSLASEIMVQAMQKWHAEIAPDPRHPAKGNFWAGHRAGWTGLNDPGSADWEDILFYYDAVMAIKAKLDNDTDGKLTTGSTRIGVNVINI